MSAITIKANQVASAMRFEARRAETSIRDAAPAAARRMVAKLADATDKAGVTDTGMLKNSWRARRVGKGAETFSDAPHAGIIELGARPHKVSRDGIKSIARWVKRKLMHESPKPARGQYGPRAPRGKSRRRQVDAEALQIAYAIAHAIAERGQKAHYLVRDNLPAARRYFAEEFARIMNNRKRLS